MEIHAKMYISLLVDIMLIPFNRVRMNEWKKSVRGIRLKCDARTTIEIKSLSLPLSLLCMCVRRFVISICYTKVRVSGLYGDRDPISN